jgi:ribosomal protein L11 methyltransferase
LIRLAVRVAREQAELVLAELLELAPSGVEEVDVSPAVVEYAVYGAPGELPALPDVRAAAGGALIDVSTSEIAEDWAERWREFHRPVVIGDVLTVRGPWHPSSTNSIEIVIDPGQAFGTGAHASTRLCLELLLELGDHTGSFLDLGCGSGVLAIAAAKLGFEPVLALDNDPAAVAAARTNAHVNGVSIEVRRHDLHTDTTPEATTIAANLLAPLLLRWAPRIPDTAGRVIASGLLVSEADTVTAAFAARGLGASQRRDHGEWSALLLERPPG